MMLGLKRVAIWLIIAAVPLAAAGCLNFGAKEKARFYVLSPMAQVEGAPEPAGDIAVINVLPVKIPGYLNRSHIMTRMNQNELRAAEYHRWAEPLAESFTRVLSENLDELDNGKPVAFTRRKNRVAGYTLKLEVIRFDGALGGEVELKARWVIHDNAGRPVLTEREKSFRAIPGSADYAGFVAALSRTVEDLSKDIAAEAALLKI